MHRWRNAFLRMERADFCGGTSRSSGASGCGIGGEEEEERGGAVSKTEMVKEESVSSSATDCPGTRLWTKEGK